MLKFKDVYKDYIWGGNKIRTKFGGQTDLDKIAENWVLSCHDDGMSIISEGGNKGVSLKEYIEKNPDSLGSARLSNELPILVKFIDAADKLSVQVHPDDEQAKKWENQNGKTEMWYVAGADKDAKITYGVKKDITEKELSDAILNNKVEDLLNTVPSKKGDVFFVEAGTIHAIGKGNLIAEIQQNSNVTYRLYDYGRKGNDGKPRELHIEKGVKCSKLTKTDSRPTPDCSDGLTLLGSCKYFQVKKYKHTKSEKKVFVDDKSYLALVQTEGETYVKNKKTETKLAAGRALFIPAKSGECTISGKGTVLLIKNPPRYFVGIDLGGTNIAAAVVDEYGTVYGRAKRKTNMPRSYQEIFDDMAVCAKEAAVSSGIAFEDIEAVGIGCPGAIDKKSGIVEFSNNLGFYDVPITEYMEKALGKKIFIENDANAAAWGEFVAGSGKNCNSMVMITLGTGVGSGIIIDGHLFGGEYDKGAEIGHMTLVAGGEKCTCGKRGCLESYASASALERQTKKAMKQNPESEMWKVCDGKLSKVNGKTAFSAKDSVAKKVRKDYLGYLADGVISVTNIFQPEVITIGGGISHEGKKILSPLEKGIKKYSFARFGKQQTTVRLASLGNDAGIIGAALLWKNERKG
ncbi:MAG: type I phosphomannose isomerase catalytic subunit [Monoglobales bacterium]